MLLNFATKWTVLTVCSALASSAACHAQQEVPEGDRYAATKLFYEDHYQRKIERVLRFVDDVTVAVDVELSTELARQVRVEEFSDPQVVSERKRTKQVGQHDNGSTNLQAQGPGRQAKSDGFQEAQEETETNNVFTKKTITATHAPLIPRRVFVSIAVQRGRVNILVPSGKPRVFKNTGQRKLSREEEAALVATIENLVQPLLPKLTLGEDEFSQLSVEFFDAP